MKSNDNFNIVKMVESLQDILDILAQKLFNNIIPGQGVLVNNNNFDTQLNKVSINNPTNINIESDENNKKRKININNNRNRNRIRRLTGKNECQEGSVLCINSNLLEGLMKNETSSNIGFQSQLNKNKNLPVETNLTRKVFSENSLGFHLSIGNEKNLRRLESLDSVYYEIRLKIPSESKTNTKVTDTACVQYANKNEGNNTNSKEPSVSCESWYDDPLNEVVCYCKNQGLTVNMEDSFLSNVNKLSQFPLTKITLRK